MSLAVEQFATRCRVPPRLRLDERRFDEIVRRELPAELPRTLAPRWPGRPGLVRVRRLPVELAVTPADLRSGRLAALWAAALSRVLLETLAAGEDAGGVETARADDRAGWLARFVGHLLDGSAARRWEYDEFRELLSRRTADAALGALLAEPAESAAALARLESSGTLERLLRLLDEAALERLIAALSATARPAAGELTVETLLAVGRPLAAGELPVGTGGLVDRRLALRLFLHLAGEGPSQPAGPPRTPRQVLHALTALAELLAADRRPGARTAAGARKGLPREVETLLAELRGRSGREPLADLLAALAARLPAGAPETAAADWVTSELAGLFLLVPLLARWGWPRRVEAALRETPGAIGFFLAGLGLAVAGRASAAPERPDPGLTLFAGCEGWLDLAGLTRFLAAGEPADRRRLADELLAAIDPAGPPRRPGREEPASRFGPPSDSIAAAPGSAPGKRPEDASATWLSLFDLLADRLLREWALRVRGFRRARRAFLVRQFIAVPGRVGVEPERITVRLAPHPFQVALRVSGADQPLESVAWLGGRRLELVLEGL